MGNNNTLVLAFANFNIIYFFIAGGLDLERRWYLYSKIRPYVPEHNQDVLCPLPLEQLAHTSQKKRPAPPILHPLTANYQHQRRKERGKADQLEYFAYCADLCINLYKM